MKLIIPKAAGYSFRAAIHSAFESQTFVVYMINGSALVELDSCEASRMAISHGDVAGAAFNSGVSLLAPLFRAHSEIMPKSTSAIRRQRMLMAIFPIMRAFGLASTSA